MSIPTHRCIVTPCALRSLTLSTLLIMSLPRLSNIKTFQIGSPFSSSKGAAFPSAIVPSSSFAGAWLRLNILSIEAESRQPRCCLFDGKDWPICRSLKVCTLVAMLRVVCYWLVCISRRSPASPRICHELKSQIQLVYVSLCESLPCSWNRVLDQQTTIFEHWICWLQWCNRWLGAWTCSSRRHTVKLGMPLMPVALQRLWSSLFTRKSLLSCHQPFILHRHLHFLSRCNQSSDRKRNVWSIATIWQMNVHHSIRGIQIFGSGVIICETCDLIENIASSLKRVWIERQTS